MCVQTGQFGNDFPWLYSVLEYPNSMFRCMFHLLPCQHEVKFFSCLEPAQRSRCRDWDSGWNACRGKRVFWKSARTSLGPSGYVDCFPGVKRLGHEVDHLASRLRMSGAIFLLPLYAFMALTGTTSPSTFFPSTAAPHPYKRHYNSVCRLKFKFSFQMLNALPRCALIQGSSRRTDGQTGRNE